MSYAMDQGASDGSESNRMRSMLQVEQSKGVMDQGAIKGSDGYYKRWIRNERIMEQAMNVTSDGSGSKLLIREHKKEQWMIHAIIDQEASDRLGYNDLCNCTIYCRYIGLPNVQC